VTSDLLSLSGPFLIMMRIVCRANDKIQFAVS
jgi:hypothetical protein